MCVCVCVYLHVCQETGDGAIKWLLCVHVCVSIASFPVSYKTVAKDPTARKAYKSIFFATCEKWWDCMCCVCVCVSVDYECT